MPPKKQAYIPGLNARPDDEELPPRMPEKNDIEYLIDEFLSGSKNPTMCLYEYCAMKKLPLLYKQEPVEYRPGMSSQGSFGFRAVVDDLAYPLGVASSKKEAKNQASKHALRALVGLDTFVAEKLEPEIDDFKFAEVRLLSDICHDKKLTYDKLMSRDNSGQYICTVVVGNFVPCVAKSFDRSEAVVQAHAQALLAQDESSAASGSIQANYKDTTPVLDSTNLESRIYDLHYAALRESAAYGALHTFLQQLPPVFSSFDHNIAAIFIMNDEQQGFEGPGKMVAFGTGNSTIAVESLTLDGRSVIDSTCIVTARRAFKRYLAQEMLNCYSNSEESIYERCQDDPSRLKLKKGFSIHLYVSHPIDGDYKESIAMMPESASEQSADNLEGLHCPIFEDQFHGFLRCKNEHGMVECTEQTPDQISVKSVKSANEMWVMSASDKLLRWNILGLQGAIFTHFTDPVYLDSVSLGYNPNNNYGHLSRAICCRVYNCLQESLQHPYKINHPTLCFVQRDTNRPQPSQNFSQDSLNWNCHDKEKLELTQGLTGKSHISSPFQVSPKVPTSRLCKAGLYIKWFQELCSKDGDRMKVFLNKSPQETKAMATVYQSAKEAFINHCLENKIGKWIHAPAELGMFTKR